MTLIFTLISGLLFGLSLPPNAFGWLEWIALVPLFIAVRRSGPIKAFVMGVLSVFVASTLLIFPMRTPEELGNAGGGCALFALLIGWTCAFAAAMKTGSPWKWSLGVGAAGVIGEGLTHSLFPLYTAMGQWQNPAVMPVASWVGIWGVSFLLYAFNALLAAAADQWMIERRRSRTAAPPLLARRTALGAFLLLAAIHLIGWGVNSRAVEGETLQVAALQPDSEEILPLLQQARREGATVVVWPELSLSEPLDRDLEKYRVPGLYQIIGYAGEMPEEGLPYNYAALVVPNGSILERYRKIRLFGSERFVHQAGKDLSVVESPFGRAGLAICYDTMFTEVVRGLTREGAQVVLVPNLDPGAHRGALHALHAAVTVFRAAENGVPLVRSEWRGYSLIVDGRGRIVKNAGMASPTVLVGDVTLPAQPGTLYTRIGDAFPFLCILLLAGVILSEIREERQRKSKREQAFVDHLLEESEEPSAIS